VIGSGLVVRVCGLDCIYSWALARRLRELVSGLSVGSILSRGGEVVSTWSCGLGMWREAVMKQAWWWGRSSLGLLRWSMVWRVFRRR